jgi:hypothetical protein
MREIHPEQRAAPAAGRAHCGTVDLADQFDIEQMFSFAVRFGCLGPTRWVVEASPEWGCIIADGRRWSVNSRGEIGVGTACPRSAILQYNTVMVLL